jgi:hypothetical protein
LPINRTDARNVPAHDDLLDHLLVTPSAFQRIRPTLDAIFYGGEGGNARAQATRHALAQGRR